ncbi:MAG: hypothetical protein V1867_03020 [Candidatus Falkowbacteria bacterium]
MLKNKYFYFILLGFFVLLIVVALWEKPMANGGLADSNSLVINTPNNQQTDDDQNQSDQEEQVPAEEIKYQANGEIDTSDWQILRDEEWGVELNYPRGWQYDNFDSRENMTNYVFTSPEYDVIYQGPVANKGEIYFHIFKYEKDMTILEMIDWFNDTSKFWPQEYEYREISVNGDNGIVFDEIDDGETRRKVVFIKHGRQLYSWGYLYKAKDTEIEKAFDKIITTVEPID